MWIEILRMRTYDEPYIANERRLIRARVAELATRAERAGLPLAAYFLELAALELKDADARAKFTAGPA